MRLTRLDTTWQLLCFLLALAAGCSGGSGRKRAARPNIVLIVVDTLRADRLPPRGERSSWVMPKMREWAASAVVFERAYSTAPWTLPSFGSLLTGRLPSDHRGGVRVRWNPPTEQADLDAMSALRKDMPTLAEVLGLQGYETAAVVTNPILTPELGLARGFDTFVLGYRDRVGSVMASWAVDRALAWIDAKKATAPYFLMLHLMDPHLPYAAPPPFRGRYTSGYEGSLRLPFNELWEVRRGNLILAPEDRAFVSQAYDEEVSFVDDELSRFLRGLDDRNELPGSLVFLTADHGEELFDHGGFEHGHTLYDELLRVPLLVWGRELRAGRVSEPVSLLDVLPTILDAAGIDRPVATAGVSLWALLTDRRSPGARTIVAEGMLYGPEKKAVIRWPYKLILQAGGSPQLYDLEADPGETRNVASALASTVAQMKQFLDRPLPTQAAARHRVPLQQLDEATRQRLRSLGYWK